MQVKNIFSRIVIVVALLLGSTLFAAAVSAQDETGRPTKKPPTNTKKPPVKKPPVKPTPAPLTVTLVVMSDQPGTEVYLNGARRGTTNAEGRVQIDDLKLGHYTVEVRKDGFRNAIRGFQAGTDSPTLVFKLEPDLDRFVKEFDALLAAGKLSGPQSPSAFEVMEKMAARFPDSPEVTRMRGLLATKFVEIAKPAIDGSVVNAKTLTREEIVKALDAINNAAAVKSNDTRIQAETAYLRGLLALKDFLTGNSAEGGGLATARAEFERALQADEAWSPPRYYLGSVLLMQGDSAAAEAMLVRTVQLEPRWVVAQAKLGAAYQASGKHKEAIEAFRKALEVDPTFAAAQAGLGLARVSKGETKEGLKDIERALQLDPASGVPHLCKGLALAQSKKKKDWELAVQELKKATQKNLNNADFLNSNAEKLAAELEKRKR